MFTHEGWESDDGTLLTYPDDQGMIRCQDTDGNSLGIREPDDNDYDEWATFFVIQVSYRQGSAEGSTPINPRCHTVSDLLQAVGEFRANLDKGPQDDYSHVTIEIGGVKFVHQPTITTLWRCPVCKNEIEMSATDLNDVGTPYCHKCEEDFGKDDQEMEPV